MSDEQPTEQVTKRKVTMRNVNFDPETGITRTETAVDYVPDDERDGVNVLEKYVADARQRWQYVTVSDELDAGPGGYHGQTFIPDSLDHPLSGTTFEATTPGSEK